MAKNGKTRGSLFIAVPAASLATEGHARKANDPLDAAPAAQPRPCNPSRHTVPAWPLLSCVAVEKVRHPRPLAQATKRACAIAMALLVACEAGTGAGSDDAGVADAGADTDAGSREEAAPPTEPSCEPKVVPNAPVPAPYTGLRSPLSPTAGVIASGKARYAQRCVLCHGASGRGDGVEGPFDPPAADLASRLRGEDYPFWRVSEGGSVDPFCTAMPGFARLLTEEARWELVSYVRDLAAAADAAVDSADAASD